MSHQMILHCGGVEVSRNELDNIVVPEPTDTWFPIPYGKFVDLVKERFQTQLGLELMGETYGVNKDGGQFFGLLRFHNGATGMGPAVGLRSSYNKSLASGFASGSRVFVCDNLCFSGNAVHVVRKQTKNGWYDLCDLVSTGVGSFQEAYAQTSRQLEAMKDVGVNQDEGYRLLGLARGRKLLTPTQANVAFKDWETPRHDEFKPRNLYSLYNCMTEGLKRGAVANVTERHTATHAYCLDLVEGRDYSETSFTM